MTKVRMPFHEHVSFISLLTFLHLVPLHLFLYIYIVVCCLKVPTVRNTFLFANKSEYFLYNQCDCAVMDGHFETEHSQIMVGRFQAKFLTSRNVRMHRVILCISNTLRKPMIRA